MLSMRMRGIAAAIALTLTTTWVQADEFDETFSFSSNRLMVGNVVGAVTIESHGGSGFEVIAHVRGADATREAVDFARVDGGEASLVISVPDERRLSYPEMRRRSRVSFSFDPARDAEEGIIDGIFRRGRGRKITVSGERGFEAWADLTIRVPEGGELVLRNGVGAVDGEGLRAVVDLSTHYGNVQIASITGNVTVDSGNGDIEARNLEGNVDIDTGNGDIDLVGAVGDRVSVDSGNGHIVAEGITCARLELDTGNGRIDASGLKTESARLDTGNGSIDLDLDELGDGRYVVDTGNGSIDLRLPTDASADVEADTGSGRVRLDVDENVVDILRRRKDNVRFRMGDGAARIRLDSGNGTIHIST